MKLAATPTWKLLLTFAIACTTPVAYLTVGGYAARGAGGAASLQQASAANGKIAFSYGEDPVELYTMGPDGSNRTSLTTGFWDDFAPSFSPDGSRVAFASNRDDGQNKIYVMD
ncbi:MAG: TolB family protein, partial [Gaiellaceae bacterium]